MKFREFVNRRMTAAMAVPLLAIGGLWTVGAANGHLPFVSNPPASVQAATRSPGADSRGFSRVVKMVMPSVVNISSSRIQKASEMRGGRGAPEMDPLFPPILWRGIWPALQCSKRPAREEFGLGRDRESRRIRVNQ